MWADPEAPARVLELLLVNACRFSAPAALITVRVAGSRVTGWEMPVSDRGQGISPSDLPKVFDRLWRADVAERGLSRGAGLGVAIVEELTDATVARSPPRPPRGEAPPSASAFLRRLRGRLPIDARETAPHPRGDVALRHRAAVRTKEPTAAGSPAGWTWR